MIEREMCGLCCGTGVNGHPDSGYTCYECNGSGGVMSEREELKPRTEEEVKREAEKIIHALLEEAAQNWIRAAAKEQRRNDHP